MRRARPAPPRRRGRRGEQSGRAEAWDDGPRGSSYRRRGRVGGGGRQPDAAEKSKGSAAPGAAAWMQMGGGAVCFWHNVWSRRRLSQSSFFFFFQIANRSALPSSGPLVDFYWAGLRLIICPRGSIYRGWMHKRGARAMRGSRGIRPPGLLLSLEMPDFWRAYSNGACEAPQFLPLL